MTQPFVTPRPTFGVTGKAPSFRGGSKASVARLEFLGFDPIAELVMVYRKLQWEVERQEKIQDGEIVELNAQGKPRAYSAMIHHNLLDKLAMTAEKLLRYKYGRVPENAEEARSKVASLVINLTKKGEVYTINGDNDEMPDHEQNDLPGNEQE